ncbi:MAG: hypothetical protein JRJ56_09085 [Deltaproteobacteria bacterium]|nr:hypothetical protein [Deltaproteobacteria bacterium]
MPVLADFVNLVNLRAPLLGKALDYLLAAELKGEELLLTLPAASRALELATSGRQLLQQLAGECWPAGRRVVLQSREVAGELRLLPVESSKYWNDIAFFLPLEGGCDDYAGQRGLAAVIVAKPDYERLKQALAAEPAAEPGPLVAECGGELLLSATLAQLAAAAVRRARQKRGYCHFVSLCAEPDRFLQLDYLLYRLKEFGVAGLGPFLCRGVLGRLHAVFPGQFCAGLTVLHRLAAHR